MNNVAFEIGSFTIYWYGILAAAGFLLAFWTASRRAPLAGLHRETMLDLAPWIIIGSLIGARFYYVVAYWEESFAGEPFYHVFMIRQGGMVWYGGFMGACLAAIIYARIKKMELWRLADVAAPSIPLGHAFGRVGCFINGCCYGTTCTLPWGVTYPEGHPAAGSMVHPTQLYEAGLNLALYVLLAQLFRNRRFNGQIFAFYLIGYALVRGFVEFFRGDYDPSQRFGGVIPPGQLVSVLILAAGIALYLWLKPPRNKPDQIQAKSASPS